MTLADLAHVAGIALLLPLIPHAIEMSMLRRLNARIFGTLMSLESAVSSFVGWVVLKEKVSIFQLAGVFLVSIVSVGTSVKRYSFAGFLGGMQWKQSGSKIF
ncbi:EamA family transporter [Burkholderia sp. GS2Y]|uniref:EamA family transporter n=1 Tax=Burkholderia theae TaxID=3143496 RepID=A0ABU9WPH9_9BURK